MSPLRAARQAVAGLAGAADVPVTPGAAHARDLARRELAGRAYRDAEPGPVERAVRAVLHALTGIPLPGPSSPLRLTAVVLVLLVLVLAVAAAARLTGRARRTGTRRAGPVLAGSALTADQLRADADAAAAQGRWEAAVAVRFRALVRGLQERGLVETSPGLTAAEAATTAGRALPAHAAALRAAAALFDGVVYGARATGADDADRLRDLDRAVQASRPAAGAEPTAPPVPTGGPR